MSVSILESESFGGAVARRGFEYQDAFVLQHIPKWLSEGAFSHVVSEAVGDVEVCYHRQSGSAVHIFHEAKNHVLTAPQFWDEIARFKAVHDASPLDFPRFVLVCTDFNSVTSPLVAMVQRLRGVGTAFEQNSPVLENSREEVIAWVKKKEQSAEVGQFVLEQVDFVRFNAQNADSAFAGEVGQHLPSIDLSSTQLNILRDKCKSLVAQSSTGPIYRRQLEAAMIEASENRAAAWLATPSRVYLAATAVAANELGLVVGGFTGQDRGRRTSRDWETLVAEATQIGDFLRASRERRCIALDAKQRISLACVLGFAFRATRGFALQIEHNGLAYRTDHHGRALGAFFNEQLIEGAGNTEGIVCVGFPTPVGDDFRLVGGLAVDALPRLVLSAAHVLADTETLNLAVAEAKGAMVRFRSERNLVKIHLFIKAPSAFAMALGHRLNGVCSVQLYDWIEGRYVATADLGN